MTDSDPDIDISQDIAAEEKLARELTCLFGRETVEQAQLLDVASLSMGDEITREIADGVKKLKQLRGNNDAQVNYVRELRPGTRLLLCMWIMDMSLLDSIQEQSYC